MSPLGWLLHLHRNYCLPAQGELPLPGLSQPGLQQKSGRPTERNVSLREVRQRVSQLQVPPYPLCKWLISLSYSLQSNKHIEMRTLAVVYWNMQHLEAFILVLSVKFKVCLLRRLQEDVWRIGFCFLVNINIIQKLQCQRRICMYQKCGVTLRDFPDLSAGYRLIRRCNDFSHAERDTMRSHNAEPELPSNIIYTSADKSL